LQYASHLRQFRQGDREVVGFAYGALKYFCCSRALTDLQMNCAHLGRDLMQELVGSQPECKQDAQINLPLPDSNSLAGVVKLLAIGIVAASVTSLTAVAAPIVSAANAA
jgi:hypothetical protein